MVITIKITTLKGEIQYGIKEENPSIKDIPIP
jgi:hypothetical protein